jgi:hypothetical protein
MAGSKAPRLSGDFDRFAMAASYFVPSFADDFASPTMPLHPLILPSFCMISARVATI